jgi:hypothetical protein
MTCIFIIHLKLDNFYLERKYIALFSISRSLTRTFLTYFLYSCNLVYVNMKEHDISHLKWNVGACWFMVEIQSPGQIRMNIVKELVISHYIDTPRWWNNIPQYSDYLRIDRNFCSVHEEISSIRLYTPRNPRIYARVCTTWLRLFRMNRKNNFDQSLWINSNFFCYDIEKHIFFFKIRQIIGNKFK